MGYCYTEPPQSFCPIALKPSLSSLVPKEMLRFLHAFHSPPSPTQNPSVNPFTHTHTHTSQIYTHTLCLSCSAVVSLSSVLALSLSPHSIPTPEGDIIVVLPSVILVVCVCCVCVSAMVRVDPRETGRNGERGLTPWESRAVVAGASGFIMSIHPVVQNGESTGHRSEFLPSTFLDHSFHTHLSFGSHSRPSDSLTRCPPELTPPRADHSNPGAASETADGVVVATTVFDFVARCNVWGTESSVPLLHSCSISPAQLDSSTCHPHHAVCTPNSHVTTPLTHCCTRSSSTGRMPGVRVGRSPKDERPRLHPR